MILREYPYRFLAGRHSQVFHIEQFGGPCGWPGRFRLRVPATQVWEAQTFYGDSCFEIAEKVTTFLERQLESRRSKEIALKAVG